MITLYLEQFSDYYLWTDTTMAQIIRTDTKKYPNNIIDVLILESVGEFVSEYQIFVKTSDKKYSCKDSDIMLCSKLSIKLKNEEFKKAIEDTIYAYFSDKTLIFFTKNDHIRIFSKTI